MCRLGEKSCRVNRKPAPARAQARWARECRSASRVGLRRQGAQSLALWRVCAAGHGRGLSLPCVGRWRRRGCAVAGGLALDCAPLELSLIHI
eukprot:3962285-Pyramimonas_sp.AAC.1